MKARSWLVMLVAVFAASTERPAVAADQTILGDRLIIRSGRIRIEAEEPGSSNTVVGDPRTAGATLRVYANGATSTSQIIPLQADRWNGWFPDGYAFMATGEAGPIRYVRIRKNTRGKFVIKIFLQDRYGPITVVPPNPGTDGGLVLTINGGDRYCTSFGGAAGGQVTSNDADLYRVRNPTAEPPCPSPSGAFLDGTLDTLL